MENKTGRYKHLTLLHSNDLHGDFLSKELDQALLGGISMLSGYVSKTRRENPNTLYCIAGDMLQGSLIDSEFRGLSTIEIMNLLDPDVACIGNHEVDYGLAHLLFLERCAQFPIVNANLFITNPYTRLFSPHVFLEIDGMSIMFIGIITDEILAGIKTDLLASFVDVEDAAKEVGQICNAYRDIDIDFTILLTHIGFEEDKKLAALLDPEWGVDVIVGGHTHTILKEPEKVGDVLIVQAGVGTQQIGRFDIVVDTETNSVHEYKWELIPINSKHCPRNEQIEETILRFKSETDRKYNRLICSFNRPLTHPSRYEETELGNLLTDVLKDSFEIDIAIIGSGSIRKTSMKSILTLGELKEVYPYDDKLLRMKVSGAQFKKMYRYMLRDEMLNGAHTEFYQFSHGLSVVFDKSAKEFLRFNFNDAPIESDKLYSIAMQSFHYQNFEDFFGLPIDEIVQNDKPRTLATSILDIFIEHLPTSKVREKFVEGRLVLQ